jgi:hypothetical protein
MYSYSIMYVLNPYYVYINSRDRESGTNGNFTYNIQMPSDLQQQFTHVVCLNALIPKSYYLIQAGENTFQLQENNTIVTITVPVGSYLLSTFKSTIGNLLTAASPNSLTYTLTYPANNLPDTGKWTYTQNNGSIVSSLIFNSILFEPFGFLQNSTNTFTGTTLISTACIKLQSEDRLLIHTNMIQTPTRDDVLVSINSSSNINFSSISWECPAPEFYSHPISSKSSSSFSFTLTDESNNIISLNGLNMNLTILLYTKDPIFDQLRNFIKLLLLK